MAQVVPLPVDTEVLLDARGGGRALRVTWPQEVGPAGLRGTYVRFRIEQLEELIAAGERPVTAEVIPIQRDQRRSKL